MSHSQILSFVVLVGLLLSQVSYAQDNSSCFDKSQSDAEANSCGKQLIYPLEKQVKSEFQRLAEKYKGNEPMQESLKNTRQSWDTYRNTQCILEGMAAAGGQSTKPLTIEANKSFLRCVHRTLLEMKAALSKL